MRKLLITQRLVRIEWSGEVRDCLDLAWAGLAQAMGWLPIPFPTACDPELFLREVPCDALLLSGGNDLGAVCSDPLSAARDAAEKALLERFLGLGRPVVGVCRGMELVGHAFGMGLVPVKGHAGVRHPLVPAPGSRFRGALERLREVNAFHDFAIAEVKGPFAVSATSPDGVIKAMECAEKRIFCQMWHSEREKPFAAAEIDILKQALGG